MLGKYGMMKYSDQIFEKVLSEPVGMGNISSFTEVLIRYQTENR